MEHLKQRIGKTVLYKANNFSKKLNSKQVYFKMEGLNPTGRVQDRIAYYLVKEATQLGFKTLTVASLGPLGISLAYICNEFGIKCKIVIPENSIDKKNKRFQEPGVEIIEYGKNYYIAYSKSKQLAKENNWYDANHGYYNLSITTSVYSEISEEIVTKLGRNPDNVILFLSNGALTIGIHNGFRHLWRKGLIDRIPSIYVACSDPDNMLLEAFNKKEHEIKNASEVKTRSLITKRELNYKIVDPQQVLNALYDSGGGIYYASSENVKNTARKLKESENINISLRDTYTIQTLENLIHNKIIKSDHENVVILEEGKNELSIKTLGDDDFESFEQLAQYVEKYLGLYGDKRDDVLEAIRVSYKTGFILGAYIAGRMKGIAVVMGMPTKSVLPGYHLIYIGSDITAGSRGIGTRLMEKIREKTEGNFSLHVDIENKKAIKLYEKMGLKKSYYRMIYNK